MTESSALPRVAAVVLAAGLSSRMAPHNKLLLRSRVGETMVARVVDAALSSRVCGVWVVLGHQADEVARALGSREIRLVRCVTYAAGLAQSLVSGIAALPSEIKAAVVCLGDMPQVEGTLINRLIQAYEPDARRLVVVPRHAGRRGNPVLWDRQFFGDILALSGDRGARDLLDKHADYVHEVDAPSDAVLRDFDTPAAIEGAGWFS